MTKLLQQALDEAKADAIYVFTYQDGISAASKDAIEYMHSWLTVYFDKQALAQQEQCGCREGECETKKDKTCRMTIEIAERDGIPEWTPAIGIECAISNLRDDAARLRGGNYMRIQIADDLEVIANDLAKCKPDAQQEQPAQKPDLWKTQFLTDVMTSAGLLMYGRTDKKLAQRIADGSARWRTELYASAPTQPSQEPVAWYLSEDSNILGVEWSRQKPKYGRDWTPLYKTAPTQPAQEPDPVLCKFYQVTTFEELVSAQEHHINKLQAKLEKENDNGMGSILARKSRAASDQWSGCAVVGCVASESQTGQVAKVRQEQPVQKVSESWTDIVAVNLVREGVNKHKARELAAHFLTLFAPPTQPALTDEQIKQLVGASDSYWSSSKLFILGIARAVEAHCRGGAGK